MKQKSIILEQLRSQRDCVDTAALSTDFLAAVKKEARLRSKGAPIPFPALLKRLIRFIGWRIWAIQTIVLLCAMLTLRGMVKGAEALFLLLMPQTLIYLSLLVSGSILPVLYRSFRYQMHEIETTTYYATPRILLAKMIVVGVGDLMILGSVAAWIALRTVFPLGSSVLFLLCPFLLASLGIMHLLSRFPRKMLLPYIAGMYALLVLGYRTLRQHCPMALAEGSGVFWGVLCLVLLALCSLQLVQIEKSSEFVELQLV